MKNFLLSRIHIIGRMLVMLLMLLAYTCADGQVYTQVTNTGGTVLDGCNNVTVTGVGNVDLATTSIYLTTCTTVPYAMAWPYPPTGAWKWDFAPGVYAVRINIAAISPGEYVTVAVNGAHINFGNASNGALPGPLSPYNTDPCVVSAPIPYTDPVTGDLWPPLAPPHVANVTIDLNANTLIGTTPIGTIYSVSVTDVQTTGGLGVFASLYFAPVAPITGATLLCVGSTTTLGNATAGGTWSSGSPTIATVSSTGVVTGLSVGTAIISYTYIGSGGCFVTTTITVEVGTSPCSPCHVFASPYTTLGTTTGPTIVTGTLAAGNYHVTGDLTISGNEVMNDVVMLIDPGVKIEVGPNSSLTLNGCHLFCCGDMWQGIVMDKGSSVILQADGSGTSTLIEDALIGVDDENPGGLISGAAYNIKSNGAIFNRNNTGIRIANYNYASAGGVYPFLIENTVFTSRDLYPPGTAGTAVWPNAGALKATVPVSSPYIAPYNVGSYGFAFPHNNPLGILLATGINLENINSGTSPTYGGVVIGAPTAGFFGAPNMMNLFDAINCGVNAVNANVTTMNNAFANLSRTSSTLPPPYTGGVGVCAVMNDGQQYQLTVEPGVAWPHISPNSFWDCHYGVYALNYYDVTGTASYMISTQSNAFGIFSSVNYGYDIQAARYNKIDVSNNTIINVANGIAVKMLTGAGPRTTPIPGYPGTVRINDNIIRAKATTTMPLYTSYVDKAIWVDNAIAYINPLGAPGITTIATADHNTITDAYNGIYINGLPQVTTTNNNTINGIQYPSTVTVPTQYGIYRTGSLDGETKRNVINGNNPADDDWRGIWIAASELHTAMCNEVAKVGRGFEFEHTYATSNWLGNTMTNTQSGFVLTAGQIGPQGNYYFSSDNRWVANSGFVWSLTSGNYQTITYLRPNPIHSSLWVKSGVTTNPTVNTSNPPNCNYTYGCIGGIGIATYLHPEVCLIPLPGITPGTVTQATLIAHKGMGYTTYQKQRDWTGQNTLWQIMLRHPILDLSDTLRSFKKMAEHSRYAWLTGIEDELAQSHLVAASLLMDIPINVLANTEMNEKEGVAMADDVAANTIVQNYHHFYKMYAHYEEHYFTAKDSADVETMAGLCPLTNGAVVYKARALYDIVFDTLRIFESNCDSLADTSGVVTISKEASSPGMLPIGDVNAQQYILYPNPNDGNFILEQAIGDNEPVQVEIYDVVGRSIYKEQLQFAGGRSKLHMSNVPPGTYLLQLVDSKRRIFKFKFVVD